MKPTSPSSSSEATLVPAAPLSILGKKIAFSALVQYIGKGIQIVLAAVSLKLISSFFAGSVSYGIYSSISEYALFFSVVANLGIFAQVVRKMSDEPLNGSIFLNAMVLRIVTALFFFMIGAAIVWIGGGSETIGPASAFLLGSVLFLGGLLFDSITSVCDGMLQANYQMGKATLALVLGKMLSFAGTLLILQMLSSLSHASIVVLLFAATMSGSFLTAALSFFFVWRAIPLHWSIDVSFMGRLLKAGLPFGIISLINSLYFRFLPDYFAHEMLDTARFGAFNISFRIAQVVSLFSTFLMFSALPGLKRFIDHQAWNQARRLYGKLGLVMFASGLALVVFGSLWGEILIETISHKNYFLPEFWFLLPMMLMLAAVSYGYDLVLITLFAVEKDRWFLRREIIALVVACIFFAFTTVASDLSTKLFLVLSGALAGESTMVILGTMKVRQALKEKRNLTVQTVQTGDKENGD